MPLSNDPSVTRAPDDKAPPAQDQHVTCPASEPAPAAAPQDRYATCAPPPEEQEYLPYVPATVETALPPALATPARRAEPVAPGTVDFSPAPPAAETGAPLRMHTQPALVGVALNINIPGYRLLGELGRGGMGVVYKAQDVKLNRLVALKMILAGDFAGSADLARFRLEAETVARLQHPNIVQVYEINVCDGKPFVSLEFVGGGSLDQRISGHPQPPREAAKLVQRLARAMQHAHENKVLHRDLKPANILITADGVPKITDFGLAKKLDEKDSRTRSGSIMGTPNYMAPEQAGGQVRDLGPAADTYSLGAILYELLTGRPPFQGPTVLDTLEMVRSDEPVPPRRLQPRLPLDIETICLKCLEKDQRKRYASSGSLADDLSRFLSGEPIHARPTPLWERGWKWARRRPAAAALAAVSVAAALTLTIGGVLYAQNEARHALKEAQDEQRRAEKEAGLRLLADQERDRAEVNFHDARDAVHQLTLIGHRRLANEPHMELVRRDILEKALAFHYRFLKANGDNPSLRWETGMAHLRAGEVENMLGRHEPAEKAYREARTKFDALHKEQPDNPDYRKDLASTLNDLGILLQATNRSDETETVLQESLDIKEGLVRDFPNERDNRRDLGNGYNTRGNSRQVQRKLLDAEADYLKALERFSGLVAEYPLQLESPAVRGGPKGEDEIRVEYYQGLAQTHLNLATVWTTLSTTPDAKKADPPWNERAEKAIGEAEKLWGALTTRYPDVPHFQQERATTLINRATLRHVNKRPKDADADYRDAETRLAKLADEFPSVPDYRQLLSNAYVNHGQLLRQMNDPNEAKVVWQASIPVLQSLVDQFRTQMTYRQLLGRSHNELAIALAQQNQSDKALVEWDEAMRLQERLVTDFSAEASCWQDLIDSHANRTALLIALSPSPAAEASARQLIAVHLRRTTAFPKVALYGFDLARAEKTHADLLLEQKKPSDARRALDNAVRHARQALDADSKSAVGQQILAVCSISLIELLQTDGDHGAIREAIRLVCPESATPGLACEKAAAYLGRCIPLLDGDSKLAAPKRTELRQTYGDEAMALLKRAVAQGYRDGKALETAAELVPLRGREDFRLLIKQLATP